MRKTRRFQLGPTDLSFITHVYHKFHYCEARASTFLPQVHRYLFIMILRRSFIPAVVFAVTVVLINIRRNFVFCCFYYPPNA